MTDKYPEPIDGYEYIVRPNDGEPRIRGTTYSVVRFVNFAVADLGPEWFAEQFDVPLKAAEEAFSRPSSTTRSG